MFAQALKQYPLLCKGVIPGTLAIGTGDVACQLLEGKETITQERTARMMITGAVCVTPMAWVVQRTVNRAVPGRSLGELLTKSVANASACVLGIVGSFAGNNLLQGRSVNVLRAQLQERLAPTYAVGFGFWTAAHLALSSVVPGLGAAVVAQAVWSVAMSRALNMRTPAVAAAVAAEQREREAAAKAVKAVKALEAEERRTGSSSGAFFHRLQHQPQQQKQQQQQ